MKNLKRITSTMLILLLTTFAIMAQNIDEQEVTMSLGKQTAYVVDIDGVDEDMAEDVWKKFVKDYGKSKRNKKAKEYYMVDAQVPMIGGSNKIDVYLKLDERVNMTTAYLWVDAGGGFVNSNDYPKEAQGAEEFLSQYYLAVKERAITEEMKEQEKELEKLDKELRKLEKKNTGYHEDIEKAKEKIIEAEKNIEQNLKDQEDQRIRIEQQKKVIEEIIERLNNLGKQ